MLKSNLEDPETLVRSLMNQAESMFGAERAADLKPEIEVMAIQLAVLRASPVELQDEP